MGYVLRLQRARQLDEVFYRHHNTSRDRNMPYMLRSRTILGGIKMTNNQPELKACMPERIWLEENKDGYCDIKHGSGLKGTRTEYRRADLTPKWQSMDTAIKHLKISYQIDEDHQSEYVKILPIHAQNIIDYLENIKGETK